MTGEPTPRAPAISIIIWKVKYPLHFIVQPIITQHFWSRTVRKAPLQSSHTERNGAARPSYINYCLKSEVSIMLRCRLCSTCYTAVRIKNCSKSTFAIKVTTMKIRTISITKGSHHVLPPNWHFSLSAKMNGTQGRTLVSPWRMHYTYCGMPKAPLWLKRCQQWKNQAYSLSRYLVTLDWRHQSVT